MCHSGGYECGAATGGAAFSSPWRSHREAIPVTTRGSRCPARQPEGEEGRRPTPTQPTPPCQTSSLSSVRPCSLACSLGRLLCDSLARLGEWACVGAPTRATVGGVARPRLGSHPRLLQAWVSILRLISQARSSGFFSAPASSRPAPPICTPAWPGAAKSVAKPGFPPARGSLVRRRSRWVMGSECA